MKTLPISPVYTGGHDLPGLVQTIHAAEKEQWMQSLTAGQIIKGRILRQYSEGRYGVSFAGQERIVDSAIPLTVGDELTGKVIGLDKQSVSVRLVAGKMPQENVEPQSKPLSMQEHSLQQEMNSLGASLTPAQQQAIIIASQSYADNSLAARVGIFLTKLGLPLSDNLMGAVLKKLMELNQPPSDQHDPAVPELSFVPALTDATAAELVPQAVVQLSEFFAKQFLLMQEAEYGKQQHSAIDHKSIAVDAIKHENSSEDFSQPAQHILNILNIQTDASMQHRFQTLPIMIDGRLREFDLALFDQSGRSGLHDELKSRHLKFSLDTEFGPVSLDAHVVNQRVSLEISASSPEMKSMLDAHVSALSGSLKAAGWTLDQVVDAEADKMHSPAYKVIEHILAQDSLRVVV